MKMKTLITLFTVTILGQVAIASTPALKLDSAWEKIKEKDGIEVFAADVKDSPLVAFKGTGVIEAPLEKVLSVIYDPRYKHEWVPRLEQAKVIRWISDTERIEYNHTATPWPLKDRDFVYKAKLNLAKDQKRATVDLRSIEDNAMPVQDYAVRGIIMNSHYDLIALDANRTQVTVKIQADPKGIVPKWLVNIFQKSWPYKNLQGVRQQVSKANLEIHPKVAGLFRKK